MNELIASLSTLGQDALTAFIVYQVFSTLQFFVFLALVTWGVRTVWGVVKHIIRE